MCVKGLNAGTGMFLDGTFRFHLGEEDLGGFCTLGTFSQYAVVSEWAARCPDCGADQPFEQQHTQPAGCPDSADGYCPEWSCTACGAALLIGFLPFVYQAAGITELHGRVA